MVQGSGPHVVVAGAGVTGLTVALALARAGARVTVCDPAPLGRNASGVAAGMLAPAFEAALDPVARGHFGLLSHGRDLWPELAASCGITLGQSGAVARGDRAWLEGVAQRLAEIGAAHTVSKGTVFTPEDWLLEPAAALAALMAATEAAGVAFVAAEVTEIVGASKGLKVGLREGLAPELDCDQLVLATGWRGGFAPEAAHLTPIKGHILKLPPLLPPGPVIRGDGVYLCPGADALTVGATMEAGVSDPHIHPGRVMDLRAAGARLLPDVARAKADVQVGVRAATPDGLPLVGPSSTSGVILAVGMRRNGWLLAPLVAQIVAAYALNREPGPWAKAFDPRRFDDI